MTDYPPPRRIHWRPRVGVNPNSFKLLRDVFGAYDRNQIAIEVKCLKQKRGDIAFTDREWAEAKLRRKDFRLIVVGNLEADPIARLIPDPAESLDAECRDQSTIAASWRATVAVA